AVLSILVIEDLVMAAYLPVVAVLLLGVGLASAALTVAGAVAVAAAFLAFSVRFGPALSRLIFSHSDEALLLTILGLALLAAGAAERLQVSAAVGAFLVGIGISGPAADRAQTLLTPLRDLFGGVFFAFFGLSLDPAAIPPVLGVALGLAAAGVVTKAATGWYAGRRIGVGVRGRLRAGGLLSARGEFSIVIAVLGATGGAHGRLAPVTAAYVLALAVLGPILARAADHLGARIVARRAPTDVTMAPEADV
ncbi:MAG TPA: cation:proton antiporter, partial [Actinomycetota bacterium]|nr:cation:proton antiporter [Actinomycetota bacterium]